MPKKYPKDTSAFFLLFEDAREEVGNKISFMGIYPNNDILLPATATFPAVLASLAFSLITRDGEGEFDVKVSLIDPKGVSVVDGARTKTTLQAGRTHLATTKLVAMPALEGVYIAKFFYDDFVIERSFEVKRVTA